ncbi:MAG: heme lyase NrfEFG subunit NrfE, partial [Alphaproteobacteria bacterium]|nr:heme lyase NrfEFG subunit NrfE [Alphaproteobacteria bacterium]
ILLILGIFLGGSLTLYAARAGVMQAQGAFGTVSRESALVLNNILLAVSAFVVFIGTIWPLLAELAFGRTLSVGPPFFDAAFTPFMVLIAIVLPLGSLLAWKRGTLSRARLPLAGLAVLSLAMAGLFYAIYAGRSLLGPAGVLLGVWVVGGAVVDLWLRAGRGGLSDRLGRVLRLPRGDWGKTVAHAGMGVTIFGVAAMTAWQQEDIRVAQVGEGFDVGAYHFTLDNVEKVQGPNYSSTMATVTAARGNGAPITMVPEKRFYPVAQMATTEAAIKNGILRDLYVVIGDPQTDGGYAMRVYIKPFANWIWGGAILMAIGGLISLSDRRLRFAVGARRAPAVPAE